MTNTIKIYVRPSSWDFYLVSEDNFSRIAVTGNRSTMDESIYQAGWEAYRDKQIEAGAIVSVHHIN